MLHCFLEKTKGIDRHPPKEHDNMHPSYLSHDELQLTRWEAKVTHIKRKENFRLRVIV